MLSLLFTEIIRKITAASERMTKKSSLLFFHFSNPLKIPLFSRENYTINKEELLIILTITILRGFTELIKQIIIGISPYHCTNPWNKLKHFHKINIIPILLLEFLPIQLTSSDFRSSQFSMRSIVSFLFSELEKAS